MPLQKQSHLGGGGPHSSLRSRLCSKFFPSNSLSPQVKLSFDVLSSALLPIPSTLSSFVVESCPIHHHHAPHLRHPRLPRPHLDRSRYPGPRSAGSGNIEPTHCSWDGGPFHDSGGPPDPGCACSPPATQK